MWFWEYSLCEILARSSRRESKGEIWLVQRQDRDYFRHCLVIRFDISRQSSGTCWKIASISATQVSTVFPATPPTLKKSSLLNNLASALFFLISLSVSSSSSLSSLFRSCLSIQRHKGALLALTSSSSLADCSYCCSYNQFWTWLTQFIQYAWRMASLASGVSLKNSFTQSSQERQHCCGGYQQAFNLFGDSSVLCTAISLSISACGISSVKSKYAEKAVCIWLMMSPQQFKLLEKVRQLPTIIIPLLARVMLTFILDSQPQNPIFPYSFDLTSETKIYSFSPP